MKLCVPCHCILHQAWLELIKGLDQVDRVPEELWTEVHNTVQEALIKTILKKKKCKEAKWCLRRAYK